MVKRYRGSLMCKPPQEYVLATDYDALLSVLRQCVGCMERLEDPRSQSFKKALAAAKPFLESKEVEK